MRVCVLLDSGGLGSRITSESKFSAIDLGESSRQRNVGGVVLAVGVDPAPKPASPRHNRRSWDVADGAPLRAMRARQRARRATLAKCGDIEQVRGLERSMASAHIISCPPASRRSRPRSRRRRLICSLVLKEPERSREFRVLPSPAVAQQHA